jgi:hypothetical protein
VARGIGAHAIVALHTGAPSSRAERDVSQNRALSAMRSIMQAIMQIASVIWIRPRHDRCPARVTYADTPHDIPSSPRKMA